MARPITTPPPRRAAPARPNRAGFTLIETMLALTIILVGVLAVMQAQRTFLSNNQWSTHAASATYLANEIREMSRRLPRHDPSSGGLYLTEHMNPATVTGWGPETGETEPDDIDDLDDLDGVVFGEAVDLPDGFTLSRRYTGPVNAFAELIAETAWDGSVETIEVDGDAVPVAMRGWSQLVTVEKVDPADYSQEAPLGAFTADAADASRYARRAGDYPLRVTVLVLYEGVWTAESRVVAEVSWIVPP